MKFARGDYQAALADYKGADTIMGVPTTGIEVAKTLIVLGRLLEARAALRRIVDYPISEDGPAAFIAAKDRAGTSLADLDARIPKLTLQVAGVDDGTNALLTIDGSPVGANQITELDPGDHTAEASAAGYVGATKNLRLEEGANRTLMLTLSRVPGHVPAPASTTDADMIWPTVGYVSLGVAGAGLLVGTISGIVSLSKASSFEDTKRADGSYPTSASSLQDESVMLAHVSTVSFVVAGAALASGIMALTLPGDGEQDDAVTLSFAPGGASLRGSF